MKPPKKSFAGVWVMALWIVEPIQTHYGSDFFDVGWLGAKTAKSFLLRRYEDSSKNLKSRKPRSGCSLMVSSLDVIQNKRKITEVHNNTSNRKRLLWHPPSCGLRWPQCQLICMCHRGPRLNVTRIIEPRIETHKSEDLAAHRRLQCRSEGRERWGHQAHFFFPADTGTVVKPMDQGVKQC